MNMARSLDTGNRADENTAHQPRTLVRAITRSIFVLQAVNRRGSMSVTDVAQEVDLPYATAFRIVQTLVHEGLLEREPARKRYRSTALVQTLSHGFRNENRLISAARPLIVAMTQRINWPLTITTRVGSQMMIRDCTHSLTSLTFHEYRPGYTFPILESSSGRVYLAFCDSVERAIVLNGLGPAGEDATMALQDGKTLEHIRIAGYAVKARNQYTEHPGKTSSIAAPIFEAGALAGALTLTFFASAIRLDAAIDTFVPDLIETAAAIGQALDAQ